MNGQGQTGQQSIVVHNHRAYPHAPQGKPRHYTPGRRAASFLACLLACLGILLLSQRAQAAETTVATVQDGRSIQIVGGQPADPGEWPWQVYVRSGPYMCGGTLIHAGWVVTAAHCVMNNANEIYTPAEVRVTLGEYDRSKVDGSEQQRNVTQVIVYPDYNPATNDHDIALLQLAAPATLNAQVAVLQPTLATDTDLLLEGVEAMVIGWGATREGGMISPTLMEVTTPLVSNAICSQTYGALTENMLCAGYAEGEKDACQGDSGGPLMVPTTEGGWKLAGIVSFGYGCARPNFYGVYTRVANYVPWMEQWVGTSLSTPVTQPEPSGTEDENSGPGTIVTSATITVQPTQTATMTIQTINGATLVLELPAGSMEETTVIHLQAVEATASQTNAIRIGGVAFTLTASRNGLPLDRVTFNQAVHLTAHYTDADIRMVDEATLLLVARQSAAAEWSSQGISILEHVVESNRLVATLTQTGDYALGAPNRLLYLPIITR